MIARAFLAFRETRRPHLRSVSVADRAGRLFEKVGMDRRFHPHSVLLGRGVETGGF